MNFYQLLDLSQDKCFMSVLKINIMDVLKSLYVTVTGNKVELHTHQERNLKEVLPKDGR